MIRHLDARGMALHLASGGIDTVVARVGKRAGFHRVSANHFLVRNGCLTGEVRQPVLDAEAKATILRTESDGHPENMIALGDGANDCAMVEAAGLGLAIGPLEPLAHKANGWICSGRLDSVPFFAGYAGHWVPVPGPG